MSRQMSRNRRSRYCQSSAELSDGQPAGGSMTRTYLGGAVKSASAAGVGEERADPFRGVAAWVSESASLAKGCMSGQTGEEHWALGGLALRFDDSCVERWGLKPPSENRGTKRQESRPGNPVVRLSCGASMRKREGTAMQRPQRK